MYKVTVSLNSRKELRKNKEWEKFSQDWEVWEEVDLNQYLIELISLHSKNMAGREGLHNSTYMGTCSRAAV